MDKPKARLTLKFLLSVTLIHVVTYFMFGFIASSVFRYAELFEMPVIRDYYKPFGSVSNYLGPLVQILRGLIFGLVLLPIKKALRESRLGWLIIWLLFIGIGILGTPSAAPSSIEGLVYSKLPLWFHLIGFPEILLQTLTFSLIVHNAISEYKIIKTERARALLKALSNACFSFIGYTIVSIAFALLSRVKIEESGTDLKVIAQFILPLLLAFVVALYDKANLVISHLILYVSSGAALMLYQSLILGSGNVVYALIAPVLPVLISFLLLRKNRP